MKKQLRALLAVLGAVAVLIVGAAAAQAYPGPTFKLDVNKHVVYGCDSFDASVSANVTCTQWRIWFLDQTATVSNVSKASHTFSTPVVQSRKTKVVHAQCTYDASAGVSGNALRVVAAKSPVLTQTVVILPRKGGGGGNGNNGNGAGNGSGSGGSGLPGTGGPALWIPIVAGLLVLAGAYTALRNRRRGDDTDQPAVSAS